MTGRVLTRRSLPLSLPGLALLVLPAFAPLAPAAAAQTMRVSADAENFRQTPGGRVLGVVRRGTELAAVGSQDEWTQVRLEGWIWSASVSRTDRAGFNLVVSSVGGENLRAAPATDATVAARLLQGFLLERVDEGGRWIRVRRTGWVRGASLEPIASAAATSGTAARPPPPLPPPAAGGGEAAPRERFVAGASGVGVRIAPGGDTVAVARPGAELEVLDRRQRWARVRLEGWVTAADLEAAQPDSALASASAADLRANPDGFQGRRVRWTVQFVALERAEPERTEFREGEPYLLVRAPDPSHGLVYVAVPEPLLPAVEGLRPLETIEILASVRTGRSDLTGVPVLDLVALY